MKQPSSKPLTVRSILVVVGLIALNVVLILAYLYFIHYPIPHSAYASGDPGRLDAQYGGPAWWISDWTAITAITFYARRTAAAPFSPSNTPAFSNATASDMRRFCPMTAPVQWNSPWTAPTEAPRSEVRTSLKQRASTGLRPASPSRSAASSFGARSWLSRW